MANLSDSPSVHKNRHRPSSNLASSLDISMDDVVCVQMPCAAAACFFSHELVECLRVVWTKMGEIYGNQLCHKSDSPRAATRLQVPTAVKISRMILLHLNKSTKRKGSGLLSLGQCIVSTQIMSMSACIVTYVSAYMPWTMPTMYRDICMCISRHICRHASACCAHTHGILQTHIDVQNPP